MPALAHVLLNSRTLERVFIWNAEAFVGWPPNIKSYKDTPKSFKSSPPHSSTLSTNDFHLLIFKQCFYTFDPGLVSQSTRDWLEGLFTTSAYTIVENLAVPGTTLGPLYRSNSNLTTNSIFLRTFVSQRCGVEPR